MTTQHLQLMKYMKQLTLLTITGLKSLSTIGIYGLLSGATLWLLHIITAPIGGIGLFSAIFVAAIAGFAAAIVVFHGVQAMLPHSAHDNRAKPEDHRF